MTWGAEPYDDDEPPCWCTPGSPDATTTPEFCPACGDPDRPAPEPPEGDMFDPCNCAYCGDAMAGLWP